MRGFYSSDGWRISRFSNDGCWLLCIDITRLQENHRGEINIHMHGHCWCVFEEHSEAHKYIKHTKYTHKHNLLLLSLFLCDTLTRIHHHHHHHYSLFPLSIYFNFPISFSSSSPPFNPPLLPSHLLLSLHCPTPDSIARPCDVITVLPSLSSRSGSGDVENE